MERVGQRIRTREKLSAAESSFYRVCPKVHPGADQMKADALVWYVNYTLRKKGKDIRDIFT